MDSELEDDSINKYFDKYYDLEKRNKRRDRL